METFTLFIGGEFSNWYPFKSNQKYTESDLEKTLFVLDGINYNSAEQFMMAQKARLFDDNETLKNILKPIHPREAKGLGRKVKNFDPMIWSKVAQNMIMPGLFAKFTQNVDLFDKLIETKGTTLVEAAPWDTIWGIGLHIDDPLALNKETWRGTNKLGYSLTYVRDILLSGHTSMVLRQTLNAIL